LKTEAQTAVFREILRRGNVSQTDLSRRLNLSRPTISNVVNVLKERGFVVEGGVGESTSRGGKRPLFLNANTEKLFCAGIWVEGSTCEAGIVSLNGRVEKRKRLSLRQEDIPQALPDIFSGLVTGLAASFLKDRPDAHILATGISLGAPVNIDTGRIVYSAAYRMRDFPLVDRIEAKTGIPTYVEDFAAVLARCEQLWGQAKGCSDFIFLQVFPSLRSIIFIGNKIHYGRNFVAGQIGACPVYGPDGRTRYLCDMIDHRVFGAPWIADRGVNGGFDLDALNAFVKETTNRRKIAASMDKIAEVVAYIVANAIFFNDPELFILDGVPDPFQVEFLASLRARLRAQLFFIDESRYRFVFSERPAGKKMQGILGMVLQRMFA